MPKANDPLAHLGPTGRALWESIAPKYVLRADERARLDQACRTADMVADLERAWADLDRPMVTRGSMGQEVIHPLIGELRSQRAALDGALVRLKLPDDEAAPAVNQQRDAANSKWATGRGRGA